MSSKHLRGDINCLASSRNCSNGPERAVEIIFRGEIGNKREKLNKKLMNIEKN